MFDSEKLVVEVQLRPCIWNSQDEYYNNRIVKKQAWDEIAQQFHDDWSFFTSEKKIETIDGLQKKWKHLRDYYVKEKKNGKLSTGVVGSARKRSTPYIDMMTFLDVTFECRKTEAEDNIDIYLAEDDNTSDTPPSPIYTATMPARIPSPTPSPPSQLPATDRRKLTPSKPTLNRISDTSQDDSDRHFLLSLLPDMKTMTDREKFEFKFEIMKAIKRIKYSNPISCPTPSTSEYRPGSDAGSYSYKTES